VIQNFVPPRLTVGVIEHRLIDEVQIIRVIIARKIIYDLSFEQKEIGPPTAVFQSVERGIVNQLRGLSDGYSASITSEIARLEEELVAIRERLKTSDAVTVKLQMRDTRRFVKARLQNLSGVWEGEPRIAREELAKHVQKITLKPMLRRYVATGT
jgi:hypothetical protein